MDEEKKLMFGLLNHTTVLTSLKTLGSIYPQTIHGFVTVAEGLYCCDAMRGSTELGRHWEGRKGNFHCLQNCITKIKF